MTEHVGDQVVSFGERLRRCREMAGLSQEQLAGRAGLSANAIGQLERGERRYPHPNTVALLAQALDLSPTERAQLTAPALKRHTVAESAASDAVRRVVPAPLYRLVGREQALSTVVALVRRTDIRLVSLTGPGGVGKTSLALEVARTIAADFSNGVAFVALGALRSSDLVPSAVAQAVGLRDARDPIESLKSYLRTRRTLLVLDNFEHLLSAAPLATTLLSACPGLKVVATSRSSLRLSGEHEFSVPLLDVPPAWDGVLAPQALEFSAVRLFVERAQATSPSFVLSADQVGPVVQICAALGGLPLALELAAARIPVMSPRMLAARLQQPLDLLTLGKRDAPPRQRSLRDTIAWSHDLLDRTHQAAFGRLGTFDGGWSLQAAEAVCAHADFEADTQISNVLESLTALVAGNLVQLDESVADGELRYHFLETVHSFARERLLASGQREAAARAHARYFLDLAEARAPTLAAGQRTAGLLAQVEADHPNFRAALDWFVEQDDVDSAIRLGAALWRFWWLRGHLAEGRARLGRLLELSAEQRTLPRARALLGAGALAFYHGDRPRARALCRLAAEQGRVVGHAETVAWALIHLGWNAVDSSNHSEGRAQALEALQLCRELQDRQGIARALAVIALSYMLAGNFSASAPYAEQSLAIARELDDMWGIAWALRLVGAAAVDRHDYLTGLALHDEGIRLLRELGDRRHLAATVLFAGWALREQGDWKAAARRYREALQLMMQVGDRGAIALALMFISGLLVGEGQAERALALAGAASAVLAETGFSPPVYQLLFDRWLEPARRLLGPEAVTQLSLGGRAMTLDVAVASVLAG